MRALGIDPVHDTRRTFDGLLEAMSRPGTVRTVPAPADHAVLATLVDHEITVSTDDDAVLDALSGQGRLDPADPADADIVHVREHAETDVGACKRGSLIEPANGATVVYRVEALADVSDGTTVTLSGPGVDETTALSVSLPASALSTLAEAQSAYPRGIDAVFASEDRLAAVPRSATMEVA
ncbi:phosphonate C-P lyase system protein PhnH [Natronomonas sp.]|uniref:phosphonate C-P lyase system protein PhnH n=1 Tax=Natronomonas sp. TaxID=2184060 RepID=UPI00261C5F32|nr:phosphonate C-P lyase system protein PhnH [Natronomonas sp.]